MTTYNSNENKAYYFPPFLSNGEIAFSPDAEGALGYTKEDFVSKSIRHCFDGMVVRSARRCAPSNQTNAALFPFGKWIFGEGTRLKEWKQSLVCEGGYFESDCLYDDDTEIHSQGFIHPELNIYALQKTFRGIMNKKSVFFDITLFGSNEAVNRYIELLYATRRDEVCVIGFKMYGMDIYCGEIRFFVNKEFTASPIPNGLRISFDVLENETVSFFYYLEDDMSGTDFEKILQEYKQKIDAHGFFGLLEECKQHYESFWHLGYVQTPDEKLNSIYKMALYNIKCNTTPYSIAVGLNNANWDGRFFAFDEYTSYTALLGANRLSLAKRVPLYRLNTCLDAAIYRASDSHRNADTEDMARFFWEYGESGTQELAPNGHWMDHVFHIPQIGIGAFEYFEYTNDRAFLEECYKMIRACAKFFTKHMVYKDGDKFYIGKCTDLERLGSSVQNPFMTACGAVRLLKCCAEAARILNKDDNYAKECEYIAEKLFENLPTEGNKYTPFVGCKQKSIAVFAGKFPFPILEDDDKKMLNAWEDFEENGASYGNMYPVGKHISPWYAGWKATAYARAKKADMAYEALREAYSSVGVFDEMFEINEPGHILRPWFSTAAGIFVTAVNEMLLQTEGRVIKILPAFPHKTDVSFKLAAKGGITVEATVKGGELKKILVRMQGTDVTDQCIIEF